MKGHPRAFRDQHEQRVLRHIERLQGMTAILQTHDSLPVEQMDLGYIRDLKYRINKTKTMLKNMGEDYIFLK